MSPHAGHRETQAGGLQASKKTIVCAVKMSKDRLSREVAEAPGMYMTRTQRHNAVPESRLSHVDLARVQGRDVMRCQSIPACRCE